MARRPLEGAFERVVVVRGQDHLELVAFTEERRGPREEDVHGPGRVVGVEDVVQRLVELAAARLDRVDELRDADEILRLRQFLRSVELLREVGREFAAGRKVLLVAGLPGEVGRTPAAFTPAPRSGTTIPFSSFRATARTSWPRSVWASGTALACWNRF